MNLKRLSATVAEVTDLSPTAKEVTLALPESLGFIPGAFVNVFAMRGGKKERRAYSISSDAARQDRITLSIRRGAPDGMSVMFWEPDVPNTLEIMGPLGLNTADKITHERVFLFAFGIGVSVIKPIAEHLLMNPSLRELWIITGNRSEEEMLYKDFFDRINDPRVHTRFVLSRPREPDYPHRGYIQDHISDLSFDHATAYLCGQGSAVNALKAAIEAKQPRDVQYMVESFE